MRRSIRSRWYTLGLCVLPAVALGAQTTMMASKPYLIGVDAGVSLPTGSFKNDAYAKTGFNIGAFAGYTVPQTGLRLQIDGHYNQNSLDIDKITDGSLRSRDLRVTYKVINVGAAAAYDIPTGSGVVPYVVGGVGAYNFRVSFGGTFGRQFGAFACSGDGGSGSDCSTTKIGFNGGAGLRFAMGGVGAFVETRIHSVSTEGDRINYLPIVVGVTF